MSCVPPHKQALVAAELADNCTRNMEGWKHAFIDKQPESSQAVYLIGNEFDGNIKKFGGDCTETAMI